MSINQPRHGRVVEPPSRAIHAQQYWSDFREHQANELEGGKNFPDTSGGRAHYQPQDIASVTPPVDGLILSGGKTDVRKNLNLTDEEMVAQKLNPWPRITVQPSQLLEINWKYSQKHKTRGYIAFITKDDWKSEQPITREQLESTPFYENINQETPYWSHALEPVMSHTMRLPADKKGHHVVVLLWLIADTGNAFYQTFDLEFPS